MRIISKGTNAYLIQYLNNTINSFNQTCTELTDMINTLTTENAALNDFIKNAFDCSDNAISFASSINIRICDLSGNIISCIDTDEYGNISPCVHYDISGNFIPCVIRPDLSGDNNMMYS